MIVLYNPHVDDFLATPPHFWLLKRKALKKYGFIIDEIVQGNEKIHAVVDGTISLFVPSIIFGFLPNLIRKSIAKFEFFLWIKINKLSQLCEVVDLDDGDHSKTALIIFSYKSATGDLFC